MAKEHHVTFFNIYPNLWTKKNLISSIFLTPWGLIQLSKQWKNWRRKKYRWRLMTIQSLSTLNIAAC